MLFFPTMDELCRINWQDNLIKNFLINLIFPFKKMLISNNATIKYKSVWP